MTKFDRCLKAVKKSGSAASPGAVCQKTVGRGNKGHRPRTKQNVTDRAMRYRANATPPAGEKRCAMCGARKNVEVGHVNGREEDNAPHNLIWNCRSCNVKAANALRKAGRGRLTNQYNPGKTAGAQSMGQWVNAVTSIRGEGGDMSVSDAVNLIHDTPPAVRSKYAKQIWGKRRERGNPGMTAAQKKAFVKRMAAARGGKKGKRKNPAEAAIETSKDFHGYDSGSVTTFITPIKYHANLAGLARLEYLKVKGPRGLVTLSGFGKEAMLTRNEKKSGDKHPQLFITGGDQSVDLSAFGISRPHEIEVLGPVVNVGYYTEKKHLIEKDGGKGLYDHKFGYTMNSRGQHVPVKNAKLPILIYDVGTSCWDSRAGATPYRVRGLTDERITKKGWTDSLAVEAHRKRGEARPLQILRQECRGLFSEEAQPGEAEAQGSEETHDETESRAKTQGNHKTKETLETWQSQLAFFGR